MFEWRVFIKGMLMGVVETIPGISSSTVAMIVGIYERFIGALNGLTSKTWKKSVLFLLPLGLGIVIALLLSAKLVGWLIEAYPQPTMYLFLGLIVSVVPFLLQKINYRRAFQVRHYVLLVVVAVLIAYTRFMGNNQADVAPGNEYFLTELTMGNYGFLFVAGWLASSAMVLPGISGALVFLLLGAYGTVLAALNELHVPVIAVVGLGIVVGVLVTSKIIRIFLVNFPVATYTLMIGLILGSTVVIFPGIPDTPGVFVVSVLTLLAGLILTSVLRRLA